MQLTIIVATILCTLVDGLLMITLLCFSDQLSRLLEPKINGKWDRHLYLC